MPTTGNIPLVLQIPGNLITANLWNGEFQNVGNLLDPSGTGGYSATDTQMQIQTDPYPSNVTSHAASLGGELERIRFQISAILGATTPAFWYADPPTDLTTLSQIVVPVGGSFLYSSSTPPASNFVLKDGRAISRTTYAALFALIGTTFGTGDGSTTFNIPNATDRMPIAAGNLYALGATGGAVSATLAANQIPASSLGVAVTDPGHNHTQNAHIHGITDPGHSHVEQYWDSTGFGSNVKRIIPTTSQNAVAANDSQGLITASAMTNISTQNTTPTNNPNITGITAALTGGGSMPVPTLSPYLAEYWMYRIL